MPLLRLMLLLLLLLLNAEHKDIVPTVLVTHSVTTSAERNSKDGCVFLIVTVVNQEADAPCCCGRRGAFV